MFEKVNVEDFYVVDDLPNVAGLKTRDNVLVYGKQGEFPDVKPFVSSVKFTNKQGDLTRFVIDEVKFDKVFVTTNSVITPTVLHYAALLVNKDGLFCLCSDDSEMQDLFTDCVEQNFPEAQIWKFNSIHGTVVVAKLD